jgi:hypothetical protein
MLILKAKLLNAYRTNDFTNYETGKVSKGKNKLQLLQTIKMKNGQEKQELLDITVPDAKLSQYKSEIGKEVSVEVGIISKGHSFFGL